MPTYYYTNKSELFAIIGEKISCINKLLQKTTENITKEELRQIIEAIDFLKDHKYQMADQGLNQLEYIIRSAEEQLKALTQKR